MSRSAALLLAFAAVALSVASARIAPEDVIASEGLLGRQLLGGKQCREKDGCSWCEDASGDMQHNDGYECQPSSYILGDVKGLLGGILGGGKKGNKWCRAKEPKEPKCDDGWFYSKSSASDCECKHKNPGYCCHELPPPPPDCSKKTGGHDWFYSSEQKDECKCETEGPGYCCYELPPPPPDCSKKTGGHDWFYSTEQEDKCKCESEGPGYCCYELPPPLPDCKDMPSGHDWFYSANRKSGCSCKSKVHGYCCYEEEAPQPPPTCQEAHGPGYFASEQATRSGCSCVKAAGGGYCCKKVTAPKPRCVKRWWYGKNRNFCEDSKPDKTKVCVVVKFGGARVRCCAKKEKNDYDEDRCFFKSINKKMRKCCYDSSRKMKKDKKHSCFRSKYNGKKGDFCYVDTAVY